MLTWHALQCRLARYGTEGYALRVRPSKSALKAQLGIEGTIWSVGSMGGIEIDVPFDRFLRSQAAQRHVGKAIMLGDGYNDSSSLPWSRREEDLKY